MGSDTIPMIVGRTEALTVPVRILHALFSARAKNRFTSACMLTLIAALAGGCAMVGPKTSADAADVSAAESLIIDDLVAALEQLHSPRTTTIQVGLDNTPLFEHLIENIAIAGYGVQRVDADQGAHYTTLTRTVGNTDDGAPGEVAAYELVVGVTTIHREYRRVDGTVIPASPLSIGGTRRGVVLDDTRLGDAADTSNTRVVYSGAQPVLDSMPLISLITDDVVRGVARDASRGPSVAAINSGRVEVTNLFYGEDSAFGDLREAYGPVDRLVVIFPNDSMRLGREGKHQIEQFVSAFQPDSDMIGLIGCSNGYTALDIGNEGLALGRSARVTEEIVSLGIARELVIDEGCWSPVNARDRFPSRGVVMELLRKGA